MCLFILNEGECRSVIAEVLTSSSFKNKHEHIMVFIMKSRNRHMAIPVSHAVCDGCCPAQRESREKQTDTFTLSTSIHSKPNKNYSF